MYRGMTGAGVEPAPVRCFCQVLNAAILHQEGYPLAGWSVRSRFVGAFSSNLYRFGPTDVFWISHLPGPVKTRSGVTSPGTAFRRFPCKLSTATVPPRPFRTM